MESAFAFSGASGIAVGLAAQDLVKSLLGGVVIACRPPFKPGDHVQTGGFTGFVQEIGWLNTVLALDDESSVHIPNSHFLGNSIVNWDRCGYRFFEETFVIRYQELTSDEEAPSVTIKRVQNEILHKIDAVETVVQFKPKHVQPISFACTGLTFKVTCFATSTSNPGQENGSIITAIMDGIHSAGARMSTHTE
mmetsp:Transcript_35028/g.66007  ORF Transcript_35028/g.66007 Transcript_35028/m.66007 type:complete len:193 (+) Transcript_35028:234-812(+)